MKRAAFLDRDGVINRAIVENGIPRPPRNVEEIEILDGVFQAIKLLRMFDITPIVVTNQPDVARKTTSIPEVNLINLKIGSLTGINFFYTCFHDDLDSCECRKPKPGLLTRAAKENDIELADSFMVGDRWRDIEAGAALGMQTFFIDHSYNEKRPKDDFTPVGSLLEAVNYVIGAKIEP